MDSDFDDIELACLEPAAAVAPDHRVNLTVDFQVTTDGINRGMFNDLPYLPPKTPSLNTMLFQGNYSYSTEVYGPQSQAFILNHLDMVEIVLNNLDANAHPCKLFYTTAMNFTRDIYLNMPSPFARSRIPNCRKRRRRL